ncbi:MAG: flagellar hook-associated protein FlgK, partial [Lachnospiraceae bacterium]|nr:flagellar hook-associated protein FlgK [Lachnospiraceae bacterium]
MPSTFWGLYISGSGLRAANANLNTTANNVSNADTEGYSRQKVKQEASDALRVFANYGCAGAGVDTLSIDRIRDDFYDVKYRDNATRWGEFDVKSTYMETIESLFTDDGITGFTSIFAKYQTKLQEVMKNPGDSATKADMISQLSSMAEYFNNMNGNLIIQQQALNTEVKVNVDKINSLASEIANLNKQINVIELTGTKANSLRDKRDTLVDELSQIVSVETQELKVLDAGQKDRDSNVTRYIVKIAGGLNLVDGTDYEELICKPRDEFQKVNQSDADGLYDIYWKHGDQFTIANSSMGGVLSGLLQLRDGNNAEYFNGKFSTSSEPVYEVYDVKAGDAISGLYEKNSAGEYVTSGDTVAADGKTYYTLTTRQAVSVAVTADYLEDMNKSTLPYRGTLKMDGKDYTYDGWEYVKKVATVDASGEATSYSYSYTFYLTDEGTKDYHEASFRTDNASVGSKINYQGIPYY